MSLRWRADGELVCGAKTTPLDDDTYIDDRLHYQLSLIGAVMPYPDEPETGQWGWCKVGDPHWHSEWRPVTTPPEAPMSVLLFCAHADWRLEDGHKIPMPIDGYREERCEIGVWDGREFYETGTGHSIFDDFRDDMALPTHWKPLGPMPDKGDDR